ncbi:TetR/AcrR family transcriptional regulator [Streptomyces sp. NPDC058257]|uniref:TetR/AcrR family transcriptional regulator n=1 Tax=Streptomyces sp. NPDC058257 TaxID=3346409 RepID=UPI0036E4B876
MAESPQERPRLKRADARRNYDRLLAQARAAFAEHGTDASLEDIARHANVGIGTLYRHFPNRHALMSAVFEEAVSDLLDHSYALLKDPHPCSALVTWLRAIITHAGEYRGLSRALMSASHDDSSALSRCSRPMREAGTALLVRAQQAGAVRHGVSIGDLMQLTNAIALAAEETPDEPELADRLLMLTLRGLKPEGSAPEGPAPEEPVQGPVAGSTAA